ncbi:efflux RND transporter periplasmic adaptor subunit [Agrobacterium rosae]|uniref:efflux RND transporter periplasmic adaptor subunit n=1 Tax=Agrobacterium rosae TaxID=1972867 RepID=UPI003A7FBF57
MRSIFWSAVVPCIFLTACGEEPPAATTTSRPVQLIEAKTQSVSVGRTVSGEVRARVQTDLSFRVSGKVVERLVDVGEQVKADQLLARIDPREQQADVAVATANLESAAALLVQAELAFQRQQDLFQTQVTTRAAFEKAQEGLLTAQGTVRSAQAQLEAARDALSYTELRADADGIITAKYAEVGQVTQAAKVMFTLAHDGPRDAVFDVVETLFMGKGINREITVRLLSEPTRKTKAVLREISPTIDPSSGTIRVKAALDTVETMPLAASVVGYFEHEPETLIRLPWSAMASKDGQPAVWVFDPTNMQVSIRTVDVAGYQTGSFLLRSGVSPNEQIVADGTRFLSPGQIVSLRQETSK